MSEIEENAERAFEAYERLLELGVAKEVARAVLPLSTYTKYYWSCNPRSLMHFCGLRNHEAAQFEIRQVRCGRRVTLGAADAGHARRLRGGGQSRTLVSRQKYPLVRPGVGDYPAVEVVGVAPGTEVVADT